MNHYHRIALIIHWNPSSEWTVFLMPFACDLIVLCVGLHLFIPVQVECYRIFTLTLIVRNFHDLIRWALCTFLLKVCFNQLGVELVKCILIHIIYMRWYILNVFYCYRRFHSNHMDCYVYLISLTHTLLWLRTPTSARWLSKHWYQHTDVSFFRSYGSLKGPKQLVSSKSVLINWCGIAMENDQK